MATTTENKDKLGVLGAVGSFVFPIVGVVIWAIDKKEQPDRAKTALTLAGISTGLWVIGGMINGSK